MKAARKKYYAENREKSLAKAKRYVEDNRDKVRKYMKAWREKNRERLREYFKNYKIAHPPDLMKRAQYWRKYTLKKYGLSHEAYESLLHKQGGRCAICGRKDSYSARTAAFNIDHDHSTGKTRGLLCTACNRALGYFGDDKGRLKKAIQYLEDHE